LTVDAQVSRVIIVVVQVGAVVKIDVASISGGAQEKRESGHNRMKLSFPQTKNGAFLGFTPPPKC
jgi:hypothetical protein